jgi:hypothetical protein
MAANYRVFGVTPWTCSLMGSKTIHGPMDQKTVSQHPDRLWTLTCFDDFLLTWDEFEVNPKPLVNLSNYLSMDIWIIENRVHMWDYS